MKAASNNFFGLQKPISPAQELDTELDISGSHKHDGLKANYAAPAEASYTILKTHMDHELNGRKALCLGSPFLKPDGDLAPRLLVASLLSLLLVNMV